MTQKTALKINRWQQYHILDTPIYLTPHLFLIFWKNETGKPLEKSKISNSLSQDRVLCILLPYDLWQNRSRAQLENYASAFSAMLEDGA